MKYAKIFIMAAVAATFIFSGGNAFSGDIKSWDDVADNNGVVSIYIEDIPNKSDDKVVDADKVTEIVKQMFTERREPKFNVVSNTRAASIIFKGKISDYVWSETAPLTNIAGAGAIVADELTRRDKQWAKMELNYKIYDAKTDKLLLDYNTQVTIKKKGMPEDESYGLVYQRLPKILAMDLFKRYKRKQ